MLPLRGAVVSGVLKAGDPAGVCILRARQRQNHLTHSMLPSAVQGSLLRRPNRAETSRRRMRLGVKLLT